MTVSFWHWWILAGILLVAEVLAPGVFFLWVAFGAALAGFVALVAPGLGWEVAGVVMAVAAVVSALFGRRFYDPRRARPADDPALNRRGERYVGRVLSLETPIVNGSGRVKVGGSYWTVSGSDLPAGAKVRVTGAAGATLKVEPAEPVT
jgi:membrane protein implicated in regulation of membrane protease activity